MSVNMSFTDEEMDLVTSLLHAELNSTYAELRRTRNPAYRQKVHQRKETAARILERIHELVIAASSAV